MQVWNLFSVSCQKCTVKCHACCLLEISSSYGPPRLITSQAPSQGRCLPPLNPLNMCQKVVTVLVLCKLKMCSSTHLHIFSQSVHILLVFEMHGLWLQGTDGFTETTDPGGTWLQHLEVYHISNDTKYDISSLYTLKTAFFFYDLLTSENEYQASVYACLTCSHALSWNIDPS